MGTTDLAGTTALIKENAAARDGKVLRPDRDVRFRCRQVPYKTHIEAIIGASYRDGRLTGRSRRRPSRKVSTFSL